MRRQKPQIYLPEGLLSCTLYDMNTYITEYLKKRGYDTAEKQREFLSFRPESLRSVADMINGPALLETLKDAIQTGKHITVYGDYDADGIMAAFILYSGLDRIYRDGPGCVHWFINNRFEDGYSISVSSVNHLLEKFPDTEVILTCDNGINAAEAIDYLMDKGIAVLVTDHHEQAVPVRHDCLVVGEKSLEQKRHDADAAKPVETAAAASAIDKAEAVSAAEAAEAAGTALAAKVAETASAAEAVETAGTVSAAKAAEIDRTTPEAGTTGTAESSSPGEALCGIREDFCGAELARRVITEVYALCGEAENQAEFLDDLYAYAGFATITDSVPMNLANHYVARRGLKIINGKKGFWGLLEEVCGQRYRAVTGETIGFSYGPMINAGGRVTGSADHAFRGLQLFYEGREQECRQALYELAAINETRKDMCSRDAEAARQLVKQEGRQKDPFLLLYGEQFSEGINGLTAAHLVEKYKVPAAVLSPTQKDPAVFKGSARSVEGFNLFEMLSSHSEKIISGGHPMAAGLQVRKEDLEEVRALLIADVLRIKAEAEKQAAEQAKAEAKKQAAEQAKAEAEKQAAEQAKAEAEKQAAAGGTKPQNSRSPGDRHAAAAHIAFDFPFMAEELSIRTVEALQEAIRALEPFGPELEPFRIALRGPVSRLYGMRGRDGSERHAKFYMAHPAADGSRIEVLWWNHIAEARERMQTAREFFFIGKPEIHEYNGIRSIQFIVNEAYSR